MRNKKRKRAAMMRRNVTMMRMRMKLTFLTLKSAEY